MPPPVYDCSLCKHPIEKESPFSVKSKCGKLFPICSECNVSVHDDCEKSETIQAPIGPMIYGPPMTIERGNHRCILCNGYPPDISSFLIKASTKRVSNEPLYICYECHDSVHKDCSTAPGKPPLRHSP